MSERKTIPSAGCKPFPLVKRNLLSQTAKEGKEDSFFQVARAGNPACNGQASLPWQEGSPAQLQAIRHLDGPMLLLAGPGSGKTFVITRRIRWLIEEGGVDPASILVITFTKAAAGEMKERFLRLVQGKQYPVNFGTFHAIYYHILKQAYHYHSGHILSESEKREVLKTILLRPGCPVQGEEEIIEELLSRFSLYKNEGCRPQLLEGEGGILEGTDACLNKESFQQIFQDYQREAKSRGKLDFDDMVLDCRRLFDSYPSILAAWQRKFRYILVDEFQDINAMQYEVLRLLALPENNLFAVGDDDQSIYAFRGARPEIMLGFGRDYPQARIAELDTNYRSTPQIVSSAGKLIRVNQNRYPKRAKAAGRDGEEVHFQGYPGREEQNKAIARALSSQLAAGEKCAVIFRTGRDAAFLAETLAGQGIPFTMKEKVRSPYRTQTAQDLLAYLAFAWEGGRGDFCRIMNRPLRYLSREALGEGRVDFGALSAFYKDRPYMQSILRRLQLDTARIRRMDLFAAVNYIRKGMEYEEYLKKRARETGKEARELLEEAEWFQKQVRDFDSLEQLREHILLYEDALAKASARREEGEGVSLLTMHASKGLEYDSVFIPDCNEGVIPHRKSMKGAQVEEERRMLYVAMTRAKKRLTITWVDGSLSGQQGRYGQQSLSGQQGLSGQPLPHNGQERFPTKNSARSTQPFSIEKEPGFLSRFLSDLGVQP